MIDRQDTLFFVRRRRSSARLVKIRVVVYTSKSCSKNKRTNLLFARRESRCFVVFFLSPKITILNDFYTNDEDEEEKRGGAQPHDETPRTLFSNSRLMMMMMMMMMIV